MFDPFWKLALGLLTGVAFGFLLQKGRVGKYEIVVGQFLGRDYTVVKIMCTAVIVGSIGIYTLLPTGAINLHIKPALWSGVLAGGVLFGIGMAVLGYCPGTGVVACGEGRKDAYAGVLGMLCGAAIYVIYFSGLSRFAEALGDGGKLTFPQLTETSPWLWIAPIAIFMLAILLISRRRKLASIV